MTWQGPPIDRSHVFGHVNDPYAALPAARAEMVGLSSDEQFFASGSTREQEELARRKTEHLESAEHIAPQHSYPSYGRTRLTEKALRENFHLPLSEVAKKFGMCTTAFKKLCRKQGVMQWPHRTLRSLEKKIASLRAEQKFTNDHNSIEDQVRKLQQKREAILSGTNLSNLEGDDVMASPSDDSSTSSTACSGSSSPRATDMSHLTLDDNSSVGSASSHSEERARRSTPSVSDVRDFQGWYEGRGYEHGKLAMPNMGPGGPRDAPGADHGGRRRSGPYNILDREGLGSGAMFHRAMGVQPPPMLHPGADPYGLPHLAPSAHPPYPPHHPMAAGPLGMPHPPPHHPMWGAYPMDMGAHAPPGGRPDGVPPGMGPAGNTAELQQHVQALLTENHTLKHVIRTMARDRQDMARRSDASQAEIANYRAVCQQLEAQLGVLSEQVGEPGSDLPPHPFPPLGRPGGESWMKSNEERAGGASRGDGARGRGERGGSEAAGGSPRRQGSPPQQEGQHGHGQGHGGEGHEELEHKDGGFGDMHHSPHAAFDLHQI